MSHLAHLFLDHRYIDFASGKCSVFNINCEVIMSARETGLFSYRAQLGRSFYQWNKRPHWDYKGHPRAVWGDRQDPRLFSIHAHQRRNRDPKKTFIRWTTKNQAWAVSEGFFIQRELERDRAVIVGVDPKGVFAYDQTDGSAAYAEIVRRCFREGLGRYHHLLKFIQQQDEYGYTGAWDQNVQSYDPSLIWYKRYVQRVGTFKRNRAATTAALAEVAASRPPTQPPKGFDELAYMNADVTTKAHKRKASFNRLEQIEADAREKYKSAPTKDDTIIDDVMPTPLDDLSWDAEPFAPVHSPNLPNDLPEGWDIDE